MASKALKAREVKRKAMTEKYAEKRAALKAAGDYVGLDKLPRNSNKNRIRNRCQITGRPRGYIRVFGLCRIKFREMALAGKLPGVTKASW